MATSPAQVLVVPPFECAWLTGENFCLREGKGCISFDVKGDNDVTIILKPRCGSRRWQHLTSGRLSPVEANYTIILGSHRNSCLKIEKDGELCHMVSNVPGSKLSSTSFTQYWVNYAEGCITIGYGEPELKNTCCTWTDSEPISDIRFVGLSAWDKHVGYRNISVRPPVDLNKAAPTPPTPGTAEPLPTLVELSCQQLLAGLSPETICSVLSVADVIAPIADGLRSRAIEAAGQCFLDILAKDPEGFQGLTATSLRDILKHQSLMCGERRLFDALVLWSGGSSNCSASALNCTSVAPPLPEKASSFMRSLAEVESLLPHIRFPQMADEELIYVASHPLAEKSLLLGELIREALEARADGSGGVLGASSVRADRLVRELSPLEAATSARFQRRCPHGCTQLIYMYDGDHNGVCWFLGTRYGTQQWVNPTVAGLLQVRASSPVSRGTDPRALISGNFLRNNFAGPRREGSGALSSWWALDLGQGHALECNYYTLRHDGSFDFLRSWSLQGSCDGETWVDLRKHAGDRAINLPGQYASWPVAGPRAAVAYRHFRILLLEPNAAAPNPYHVSLSNIELYGNFFRY